VTCRRFAPAKYCECWSPEPQQFGEVKGEPVGIEYYRLRALEHFLNARTADDQQIQLKLIPRAKEQLLGALASGEGDLAAPGELLPLR
jgi:membrane-bound lytic murein transglycosylase MltF